MATSWDGNGAIHRDLFDGAWGADVRNVQQRLNDQLERQVKADARYGPRSKDAAKDLLYRRGWPTNGRRRHPLSQQFQLYIREPDRRPADWKQRERERARPNPPAGAPNDLPREFYDAWEKPWLGASYTSAFRDWLWRNGYVAPHYHKDEWASKGGPPCSHCSAQRPPDSKRAGAQLCAFRLERVRHANGDRPLTVYSYFRNTCRNPCVGGASLSRHLEADAADAHLARGSAAWHEARRQFAGGGIGYQGYVGGDIRHVDCGPARVWVYA